MKPKKPAGISSLIEQAGVRQGIGAWLQQLAQAKSAPKITAREEFLQFLGDETAEKLTVILKKTLKSASGFVVLASVEADGFTLSDSPMELRNKRCIKFAEVSIYFVPSQQRIATG
jgi:hypothetical protein